MQFTELLFGEDLVDGHFGAVVFLADFGSEHGFAFVEWENDGAEVVGPVHIDAYAVAYGVKLCAVEGDVFAGSAGNDVDA